MPSILPGYENDIFISYRHNDNRSGWVTEFVDALKEELAATIKEPLSIYFDRNPHDGLLETHLVDQSLEGKLKCLILIPIISQTYCDPKSFAWQHEFCAFNSQSKQDAFGRDVKLANGNVASRILPIRIHDLDPEDKTAIEGEIGGILRAIDFIYREPGVNRPLKSTDNKADNQNKTDYRNQVNKVANAVKELIHGLQSPHSPVEVTQRPLAVATPIQKKGIKFWAVAAALVVIALIATFYFLRFKKPALTEKSIAVLPFENMNGDPAQDYLSGGMTEDILNHLTKIADLKVKSRTSTLQYKNTTKTAREIGEELGVTSLVEGSVRKVGEKVRIVVQLIDARNDEHLISETYDRDFKDILALQSEIAIEIAHKLEARLTSSEKERINKEMTHDASAYDYYLRALDLTRFGRRQRADLEQGLSDINKAIAIDNQFAKAYALKAFIWRELAAFGIKQQQWQDSAIYAGTKATEIDPSMAEGYMVLGMIYDFLGYPKKSGEYYQKSFELAPGDPATMRFSGLVKLRDGQEEGADILLRSTQLEHSTQDREYLESMVWFFIYARQNQNLNEILERLKVISPKSTFPFLNKAWMYERDGEWKKAIEELLKAERLSPADPLTKDRLAWNYFRLGDYPNAIKYWSTYPEIEKGYEDKTQALPFRARLGMVYLKVGRKPEAVRLIKEDSVIVASQIMRKGGLGTWDNFGGSFYALAVDNAMLGHELNAIQDLDSAWHYRFAWNMGYAVDPAFEGLRNNPDYQVVVKKNTDFYIFLEKAFTGALNRARTSQELKWMSK